MLLLFCENLFLYALINILKPQSCSKLAQIRLVPAWVHAYTCFRVYSYSNGSFLRPQSYTITTITCNCKLLWQQLRWNWLRRSLSTSSCMLLILEFEPFTCMLLFPCRFVEFGLNSIVPLSVRHTIKSGNCKLCCQGCFVLPLLLQKSQILEALRWSVPKNKNNFMYKKMCFIIW